jgi:ATP-dependent 26S proteasome regulatory subunit
MEEEFVTNQEQIKPHTERAADDQSKVDELRGSPMSVGNLEEIIDDKCVHPTRRRNPPLHRTQICPDPYFPTTHSCELHIFVFQPND